MPSSTNASSQFRSRFSRQLRIYPRQAPSGYNSLYSNTIGAAQLAAVWTDPDFKPNERAFYYVRAIEIPTPLHSTYDAVALGIDVYATGQPATIQERAYSSPIWYTPQAAPASR